MICECKKLIDKEVCDKEFIWNPSNCRCECDTSFTRIPDTRLVILVNI